MVRGTKDDPPMPPGDQAEVDSFYQRNRARMDPQNPNLTPTRREDKANRRQEKADAPTKKKWK